MSLRRSRRGEEPGIDHVTLQPTVTTERTDERPVVTPGTTGRDETQPMK